MKGMFAAENVMVELRDPLLPRGGRVKVIYCRSDTDAGAAPS